MVSHVIVELMIQWIREDIARLNARVEQLRGLQRIAYTGRLTGMTRAQTAKYGLRIDQLRHARGVHVADLANLIALKSELSYL